MNQLRALVLCGFGALTACSVGDFPLRRDAASAVETGVDAPPVDALVVDAPPDVSDAGSPMDVRDAADASVCPPAQMMCGTMCVDTSTDVHSCGTCGHDCAALPHVRGSIACVGGRCQSAPACADGFGDCNGDPNDGCEADTTIDSRCGGCGIACMEPTPHCQIDTPSTPDAGADAGADASDVGADVGDVGASDASPDAARDAGTDASDSGAPSARYVCRSGCEPLARCGGACVNTQTSLVHCGACGTACPAVLNGSPTCAAGSCRFACTPGFGDCDGVAASGCEVELRTTVDHCGMCGNACPARPSATASCAAGVCGFLCNAGFADCDRAAANGCEADTRSSATHCGGCGTVCPSGPNSVAVCRSSSCAIQCATGFADCDGDAANGCEVNTRTSTAHCGACRAACPGGPNATAVCSSGTCGLVCRANFGNCDGFDGNGCETNLTTTATHCGSCETACPQPANTVASCTASVCGTACVSSGRYGDCDGNRTNGCEADLWAQGNCGCCGRTCGMSCFMGVCIPDGTCH